MSTRDTYARAGKAGRDAIGRAVEMRTFLKPRDRDVLLACLALTALYSRTSETTTVGQVAELAGVSYSRTSDSLGRLHDTGVIVWKPSKNQRGTSRLSLVGARRDLERLVRREAATLSRHAGEGEGCDDTCSF